MKTTDIEQARLIVTTPPQATPKTQVSKDGFTSAKIKNSNKKSKTCVCNFAKLLCCSCASSGTIAGGFCVGGLINSAIRFKAAAALAATVEYKLTIPLAATVGMGAMTGGLYSLAAGIAGYQIGKCIDQCLEDPEGMQGDISEDSIPLLMEEDTDTE